MRDSKRPFTCAIVGAPEGPEYANYHVTLKKLHRELELHDCVSFEGAQPFNRIMEKYEETDIFVLPCVVASNGGRDISPNSVIEAMAMKLPVVSTTISDLSRKIRAVSAAGRIASTALTPLV